MRLTSFSLITSAVLLSATVAQAEGHGTMEAPAAVSEQMMTAPAEGTYIVLGILAALLIAAMAGDSAPSQQDR